MSIKKQRTSTIIKRWGYEEKVKKDLADVVENINST